MRLKTEEAFIALLPTASGETGGFPEVFYKNRSIGVFGAFGLLGESYPILRSGRKN